MQKASIAGFFVSVNSRNSSIPVCNLTGTHFKCGQFLATTSPSCMKLLWFRQDLRLTDNPALVEASQTGQILPIYILDDLTPDNKAMGSASRVWLYQALTDLNKQLDGQLRLFKGDAQQIVNQLSEELPIEAVHWNRCYEPWRIARDKQLKHQLQALDIAVHSHNSGLLWEPWEVTKKDGTPYRVFTPYYNNGCLAAHSPRQPLARPTKLNIADVELSGALELDELGLIDDSPGRINQGKPWPEQVSNHWQISEAGAQQTALEFFDQGLGSYRKGRDFPALRSVSRLSPYLHWGQISPHQLWYQSLAFEAAAPDNANGAHFRRELGWREFAHSLLYWFPQLPDQCLQGQFDRFPWSGNPEGLRAWQRGQTGYPIVDAGMRELWQTGYMHNRVRMVVGSFLVKNLLVDWRHGRDWFWDCLFDASLANNSMGWQWIAGCGADAAPYFRVFNPVTQGEKFDALGSYTRLWVPELGKLPNKYLHRPWDAPPTLLESCDIHLGSTYPKPIVDLKESRIRALEAYASIKQQAYASIKQ